MRIKFKISLDWEEINRLSPSDYWKFVEDYMKQMQRLMSWVKYDYLRKKGWKKENLDVEQRIKLSKALNNRKAVKEMGRNLLNLNFNRSPFNISK